MSAPPTKSFPVKPLALSLGLLMLVAGATVLFFFDPSQHSFFPSCMFYRLTGLHCPGCGAQRALHHLIHGHLLTALHYNPLLILSLPLFAGYGYAYLRRELSNKPPRMARMHAGWIKLIVFVVIAFAILRNIPYPPFTYLAPPQ